MPTFLSRPQILVFAACSLAWSGCWGRGGQEPAPAETSTQPKLGHQPTQGFPATTGTDSGIGTASGTQGNESIVLPPVIAGYPNIASCTFPDTELLPDRDGAVVVTSTDHNTGAIGWINPKTKRVHADLGLAHTDTRLKHNAQYNFLINRFQGDSITLLARDNTLTWKGSFSVTTPEEPSSNPHDVIVDSLGHLHISFLGRDHIKVYDISNPADPKLTRKIDLSPFADADGLPESSLMIQCGDIYFVLIQRLDRPNSWVPVDHSYLVPVNALTGQLYDFDGSNDGRPDGLRLLGTGMSRWRKDPRDPEGSTILALNRGLESVNLRTGVVQPVIPESIFEGLGMKLWDVRSFVVSPDGRWVYILAIDGWPNHTIFRASLEQQGRDTVPIMGGLVSVDASMIRVGNTIWLADSTDGASGVRIFDIQGDKLVESPDSPLLVGLAPYWLNLVP